METKLLLLLLSLIGIPIGAMETSAPDFLTPEQVLQNAEPLPEELKDGERWINEHRDMLKQLQLPEVDSFHAFSQHAQIGTREIQWRKLNYHGETNFNFLLDSAVIKCAGFKNQLHSKISSSGIDPIPKNIAMIAPGGYPMYRDDIIAQATHCQAPCHQHTSAVAYYLLMKKRLEGKKVQPVPTYPLQYGDSTEFHDGNWVVIQPRLPEKYILVNKLPSVVFDAVIDKEVLPDLAYAVDAGGWNLDGKNLWYDSTTRTFHITDLEKPNNEGFGPQARWKTAVLNNGEGTETDRAWKWNHNRNCGYDAVRSMLSLSLNKDTLLAYWDQLRQERMSQ